MIKHFLTVYLPAMVVTTTAIVAGVFLYQDNDPQLEQVEFVESVGITEDTEQGIAEVADQTEDAEDGSLRSLRADEDAEIEGDITKAGVGAIQELPQNDIVNDPIEDLSNGSVESLAETQASIVTVTISGPGVSQRCEVEVIDSIKAHVLMQQAAQQCGFSYAWKNYPSLGVFVEELAGVQSNKAKGKYWIYYVNGKKANVGVSSYVLEPGDLLAWQFEQEY